jgi:hypothetical protein
VKSIEFLDQISNYELLKEDRITKPGCISAHAPFFVLLHPAPAIGAIKSSGAINRASGSALPDVSGNICLPFIIM